MASVINSAALPAAMNDKLRAIRRRMVLVAIARAVASCAAVLMVAMVLAMAVDWWLTLFSTTVRLALSAASVALAAAALVLAGFVPLRDALRFARAASEADGEVPQLEERWTTVASFAASGTQPDSPTARAMLQQVTSEAVALGRLVKPAQVARPVALKQPLVALLASAIVLSAFLSFNWAQTSVLLQRFWSPLQNITATQLICLTGDCRIPRGESVEIVVEQRGLKRQTALLEVASRDGVRDVFELDADSAGSAEFRYELSVVGPVAYRVTAGDGHTRWHRVTAIDYPELEEVQLTVTPPEYVDRSPYRKSVIPGRIKVVEGSRMELAMKPAAALECCVLELTEFRTDSAGATVETERPLQLVPDDDGWYRFEALLFEDLSFRPRLLNADGLQNEDARVCRIQVIADKAPVARIVAPTEEMAVAVDDVIDIRFEAHDDFGVASAELVVYEEFDTAEGSHSRVLDVRPIDLGDQRLARHVMGQTQLDLRELGVEEGHQISYAIRVTDNRDLQLDTRTMAELLAGSPVSSPGDSDTPAVEEDRGSQSADTQDSTDDDVPAGTGAPNDRLPEETLIADAAANGPSVKSRSESDTPSDSDPGASTGSSGEAQDGTTDNDGTVETGEPSRQARQQSDPADPEESSERPATPPAASASAPAEPNQDAEQAPAAGGEATGDRTGSEPDSGTPSTEPSAASVSRSGETDTEAANAGSPGRPDRDAADAEDPDTRGGRSEGGDREGAEPVELASSESGQETGHAGTNGEASGTNRPSETTEQGTPREQMPNLNRQRAMSGQDSETGRRRLRITERLLAIAQAATGRTEKLQVRDRIEEIDRMLKRTETALTRLVDRNIPDADRAEQFRRLDEGLGSIETCIADLRDETKDEQFAFIGLQMVHIATTHVTPARNRVFAAIREPLGTDSPRRALRHIVRAREMLTALLKRYDRVSRERALAEAIDESVKMYEIYVEKMQTLMREARQNLNPLERKMAVVEVDQDFLDRFAEVETLRREMMSEFGRMLGDDPRLLARYLDILRRRRKSLRDELTELTDRQEEVATELRGWLQVGEEQRPDLWKIVAEMRLQMATPLAREADELLERVKQSLPLILKDDEGTAALVLQQADAVAAAAREITFDVRQMLQSGEIEGGPLLTGQAENLVKLFGELDAALDQLAFENEGVDEVTAYVNVRLVESRTVADLADAWAETARQLQRKQYAGLAEIDQQQVAVATELLRVEMLRTEEELEGQFQQVADADIPGEIVDMVRDLHRVMETTVLHQNAAGFHLAQNRLEDAGTQQMKALDALDRAGKLFDRMRRAVVAELDQYEPENPDIADLEDPSLDRFLEQLEREPNIEALLGIPRRPRNLRVLADSMMMQQDGSGLLAASGDAARQRAIDAIWKQARSASTEPPESAGRPQSEGQLTDADRQERERARRMQEVLEKALASVQEKMADAATSPEQRRRLEQMAENMKRLLESDDDRMSAEQEWERIVESDQARAMLQALAQGQQLPDSQWNRLLSTLDDGLWQVRGRTPPEDYRKAIEQYQERLRNVLNPGVGIE